MDQNDEWIKLLDVQCYAWHSSVVGIKPMRSPTVLDLWAEWTYYASEVSPTLAEPAVGS